MLTPSEARDRAQEIVDRAVKAGADAADAVFHADTATEVSLRLGALEDVHRAESADLSLRVFVGQRTASVSTSDFADLDALAARAVAMAKEAPEDAYAGLAPAERLMHGAAPDLDLDDHQDIAPERLKELGLACEDAARAVDGVTNSQGGGASASRAVVALATSHGFAGAYSVSSYGVSASVLAGSGGAMERDYAHHGSRHFARLEDAATVGTRAGERAVARLNPGKLASGAMPVVFDPRVGSSLIGHLIGAIAGSSVARRTSFLLDALGTQVFARGVTICDDPQRPRGLGSRPFDGEGLPVGPVTIVDDGLLETWLLESASARQLGFEPTGHATRQGGGVTTSNLYMANGKTDFAGLIEDIAEGVYVTELIGMGVNTVTGDYSRGASGFRIVNGEIAGPVSEFTVAGNLKDMYAGLTPANDLEFRYSVNVPTLRVDGMMVAGG